MPEAVDILMYHSISDRGGPTSISPAVFRGQMQALAASGRPVVDIDRLASDTWPSGAVVLTFDDAFEDLATTAWPILSDHGFPAIVYVPTDHVGRAEGWAGAMTPPRKLMDWETLARLNGEGLTIGNHTQSHTDLTTLSEEDAVREIEGGRTVLEEKLGLTVRHFAAPYGRTGAGASPLIRRHHKSAVGTRLGQADADSDLFDLPRIEMFYYQGPGHWQRHLAGRGRPYLTARRGLRRIRDAVSHPGQRK